MMRMMPSLRLAKQFTKASWLVHASTCWALKSSLLAEACWSRWATLIGAR